MNSFKALVLAGLAGTALLAGQAMATTCPSGTQGTPTCIATNGGDGANSSLQDVLDSHLVNGDGINVYEDQANPSAYWQIGGTGYSINVLELEITANAGNITFGIYDPSDTSNKIQLFSGGQTSGAAVVLKYFGDNKFGLMGSATPTTFSTSHFGYYLQTSSSTFYSDSALNGGDAQMVAYEGDGSNTYDFGGGTGPMYNNEFLLAWEDAPLSQSDRDYNDFLVMAESIAPVPEPAALGMFGLGVLLIGAAVLWNRRRTQEEA